MYAGKARHNTMLPSISSFSFSLKRQHKHHFSWLVNIHCLSVTNTDNIPLHIELQKVTMISCTNISWSLMQKNFMTQLFFILSNSRPSIIQCMLLPKEVLICNSEHKLCESKQMWTAGLAQKPQTKHVPHTNVAKADKVLLKGEFASSQCWPWFWNSCCYTLLWPLFCHFKNRIISWAIGTVLSTDIFRN